MILVDANLLIYAKLINFDLQHQKARQWLDERLSGAAPVGLPWASLLAFLRVATNTRLFSAALPMADAVWQVSAWLSAEPAWVPTPTDRHAEVLGDLLKQPGISYNIVPDAHLAALAIEHGLTLCSSDRDFRLFAGLRWEDPLAD